MPVTHRQTHVLLIEDNPTDAELVAEALETNGFQARVTAVEDGAEALDLLTEVAQANGNVPDLVLLDLKLPVVPGRDVLAFIKGHPRLMSVPVVILTSSEDDADVRAAYEGHANCYVTKPFGVDAFLAAVRATAHFWLTVATVPDHAPAPVATGAGPSSGLV